MSFDPDQYEILTASAAGSGFGREGDADFDAAVRVADYFTLARSLAFLIAEFCTEADIVSPIETALLKRCGCTEDELTAIRAGDIPMSYPTAYEARGPKGEKIVPSPDRSHLVNAKTGERWVCAASDSVTSVPPPSASVSPSESSDFPMSHETTLRHPQDLPDHPLLAGIPVWQASQPEFQALKESIRERGLDYPVLIDDEGNVVDGRNRRNASAALGIEVPVRIVPKDQIAEVIISSLGCRRHVGKGAMAYLLAPLLRPAVDASRARRLQNLKTGHSPSSSQKTIGNIEDLADSLGFGRNLLFQALDLHKKFEGKPELRLQFEARVIDGELGVGAALQAIAGKLATEGKEKVTRDAPTLILRAFTDLRNRWSGWGKIPETQRAEVTAQVVTAAADWPAEVATATAAAWRKAGLI